MKLELPPSLAKRYEARAVLGEGGFGQVLLCLDRSLDREVALKRLRTQVAGPEAEARFKREAQITAALSHPGVVQLLDYGILPEGGAYIAYERIDGQDLQRALTSGETYPPDRIRLIGIQLAEALAVAHQAGVIHRDVKPANVLLRSQDEPVLVDFGIARTDAASTQYTAEGVLLGTPAYMAPELWSGQPVSPESDQFALAATLVALAGGGSIYSTFEIPDILARVRDAAPLEPALNLRLGDLRPVLKRALARRPQDRFPDAAAFAAALEKGVSSGPPPALHAPEDKTLVLSRTTPFVGSHAGETPQVVVRPAPTRRALPALLLGIAAAGGFAWAWSTRVTSPPVPSIAVDSIPSPEDSTPYPELALLARRLETVEALLAPPPPAAQADGDRVRFLHESYPILVRLSDEFLLADLFGAHRSWLPTSHAQDPTRRRIHGRLAGVFSHLLARMRRVRGRVLQSTNALVQLYLQQKASIALPDGWTTHDFNRVYEALRLTTDRHLCDLQETLPTAEDELLASATVAALTFDSFSSATGNGAFTRAIPERSRMFANQLLERLRRSDSATTRVQFIRLSLDLVDNTYTALLFSERERKLEELAEEIQRESPLPIKPRARILLTMDHLITCYNTGLHFRSQDLRRLLQLAGHSLSDLASTEILPEEVLKTIEELPDRAIGQDIAKNSALKAFEARLRAFSARRPPPTTP